MLLTQHAIIGSAIAVASGNPILGFAAGVVSHHILDALPHLDGIILRDEKGRCRFEPGKDWSRNKYWLAYMDVIISGLIVGIVAWKSGQSVLVLSGAAGAVLPDVLDHVPWWKNWFRSTWIGSRWHRMHTGLHFCWAKYVNIGWLVAAVVGQVLVTIGGIWFSLAKR